MPFSAFLNHAIGVIKDMWTHDSSGPCQKSIIGIFHYLLLFSFAFFISTPHKK